MADYDIGAALKAIEDELIASMMRNMQNHRVDEAENEKQWEMWQAKQLESLEEYKRKNRKKYKGQFSDIDAMIDQIIRQAYDEGGMEQEIEILNAIKKRYGNNLPSNARRIRDRLRKKLPFGSKADKDFFQTNDKGLDALVHATTSDMRKAEAAMLRMADDQYRKIIFNAQAYAISGAGTYEKAVDMATKDFLSAGINCVEYKNGRRVNIKSYAEMAIRTADKRARLYADGEVRKKLGIATVITKKRMNACPKCLPFVDKILIDDVWSGGKQSDGAYPLLSSALSAGFLHPNCKDHLSTYIPGVTNPPEGGFTDAEIAEVEQNAKQDAEQQYAERQAEKFERLAAYSLDKDNQSQYKRKADEWESKSDILKGIKGQIEKLSDHDPVSLYDIKSKYRDDILGTVDQAPDSIRRFIEQHRDEILFINEMANMGAREGARGIRVNLREDLANERGKWCSTFHEIGHRVDRLSGRMSADPKFEEALKEDFENLVKGYQGLYNKNRVAAYRDISQAVSGPKYHSVSDLFGGVSGNQCVGKYAHREPGYWQRKGMLGGEAFAHFFEAMARNDTEKMDILRQSFPKAYNLFEKMMEDLV